jgi:adenine-specific DNA-methyltransferase
MDLNAADGGNRKSISVQLPELTDEKSEAYKAGYKTIADISKERIRRAGKKIQEEINAEIRKIESQIKKLQGELPTNENKTEIENLKTKIEQLKAQDLGFKVLKLADSNFKQWQQIEGKDAKALAEQMKLFIDPVSESATIENMVYELLLKSGKELNSRIEKKESFYTINGNELVLLLEKATQEIIDSVIAEKPVKVVALDKLFKGNDQLKTNTVLQMRDAGIEFKTI